MKEENMLYAFITDKIAQCEREETTTFSYFLDGQQRILVEQFCQHKKIERILFWGGYDEAERTVCFFLPWYLSPEEFYLHTEKECPFALLRIRAKEENTLSHRDYLGALMGLGIKRELVGDILVSPQGCDIFVFQKIIPYLQTNYEKAGRIPLTIKEIPFTKLAYEKQLGTIECITVSSLRLDVLVSAIFHLSRTKAAEYIHSGVVFVNDRLMEKPEKLLQAQDKIVLRGKGKSVLREIRDKTRKEKILLSVERYF